MQSFRVCVLLYLLLFLGAVISLSPAPVSAATGILKQINFQGKVVNKTAGTNITDGTYSFTFKIYSVDSGGAAIWTETKNLTVTNGIFQTLLGDTTTLPGSVDFNTDNIYLGIEFNSDGEMSPRIRFAAVPQALNALKVAGLTVTDTTGTLTIPNGTTIAFSGANNTTFTTSGATSVTLPTTGTLSTLAGSEILTNKTIGSTGLLFENSESISNGTDGTLFFGRNDAGTVTLTAKDNDSTAALTILPGGAAGLTLGGASTTGITFTTDSTGDGEISLPNDSIGVAEVNDTGDTPGDEECLTYEASGTQFQWETCGGGGTWDTIGDPSGNGAIAFGSTTQTMDWGTMDANGSFFTFNFTNSGTSAGTDNGVVINNAVAGSNTDTTTETLLLLQQLDTTAAGTTVVDNALKIDVAANSGITDGIEITNSAGNLTNGLNIVDTAGGTIDKGIVLSGTFTTAGIDAGNSLIVNVGNAGTDFLSNGGLTLANALTVTTGGATVTAGGVSITAGALAVNSDSITSDGELVIDGTSSVVLGTTTNGMRINETFDATSGFLGAARPTKTMTLSPEYAGATLTAFYGAGTDTNITGTMTADVETSAANKLRTYYHWERTQSTQHFQTVAVRVTLPKDFAAWPSSGNGVEVDYVTESGTNTNSDLDVRVYLESDATTAVASSLTDQASTSWTTIGYTGATLDDASAPEWDAADEVAVIYLRMGSASGNHVRVGDIRINYLSRF